MTKQFNAIDEVTLSDLMGEGGTVLEIGENYEDEEEFSYSPDVQCNSEEALRLLNLDDFAKEENEENGDTQMPLFSTSFDILKAKMTDIGYGKVKKLIKEEGIGDIVPHGARVTISYVGYFEYHDEPFDSTFTRGGSDSFRLNECSLIPGLYLGISTMRKHETALFIIHPDLAYGIYGCPPRIPPNEEVAFSVRLIDFLDNGSADTFENLSMEEKKIFGNVVTRVHAAFNTAKNNFKRNKIKLAIREYLRVVNWLESAELQNEEEEKEANKLLSTALSNLAVCYNKENMPRRACIACNKVIVPTAKTRFNHGRALLTMGEYDRAMQELQISLRMEPNNKDIIQEILLVNEKQRIYLDIEKRLWGNCLNDRTNVKEEASFQKVAREMCETFARDTRLLRQALPEGLTAEEDKQIRAQAAALGLSVTTHSRYGREITYINKPNY